MLYKNKLINDNGIDIYCVPSENDVEWYVYGSASDGRVATVYPRFPILDNNELYKNHFEDSPPNPAVAYNTEMVSNTFTAVALSASITGIETHRHLGEKRYEIKDHLGNVRAVVSDIKNAVSYTGASTDWKYLADVRSLNNYFPYGLKVKEGSWSASNYQFAYNGKQEEVFDKDFLDFGARTHNALVGPFINTDPLETYFPNQSPYVYANNNPIANSDFEGKYAVQLHYQLTEDAYNELGIFGTTAEDVANCASVYADHPDPLIRIGLMISYNMYDELKIRNDLYDYSMTEKSQRSDLINYNLIHSMQKKGGEEANSVVKTRALTQSWNSILSLTSGNGKYETKWDKDFKGESDVPKFGRALHTLQDSDAHGGIPYESHISWKKPFSSMYYIINDQFGFFGKNKAKMKTMSGIIVYELGKNNPENSEPIINFLRNNNFYMSIEDMTLEHKTSINYILSNYGFQMDFNTGRVTENVTEFDSPLAPAGSKKY